VAIVLVPVLLSLAFYAEALLFAACAVVLILIIVISRVRGRGASDGAHARDDHAGVGG
jgi:membrane protein implicated in regulation of membrane protease activity